MSSRTCTTLPGPQTVACFPCFGTAHGHHATRDLQALVYRFVAQFVQCRTCGNPETDFVLSRRRRLELKCRACGKERKTADQHHKLVKKNSEHLVQRLQMLTLLSKRTQRLKMDRGSRRLPCTPVASWLWHLHRR